ncbi:MAG: hypothetical protein WBA54_07110 [Acidaminobacteraceae bacterium]
MKLKSLVLIVISLLIMTSCNISKEASDPIIANKNVDIEYNLITEKADVDLIAVDKISDVEDDNNDQIRISATQILKEIVRTTVFEYITKEEASNINVENIFDVNVDSNLIIKTEVGKDEYGFDIIDKCIIAFGDNSLTYKVEKLLYGAGVTSISIIDLDKNDDRYEVVISEGELADRITNRVYRISKDGIELVDNFWGLILNVPGNNTVNYWGGNIYEANDRIDFKEELVISYRDVLKKEYVFTEDIVGKVITIDRYIKVFASKENVETGAPVEQTDVGLLLEIPSGEKIKVTKFVSDDLYQIQLEDGSKGYIGGFHMVWD